MSVSPLRWAGGKGSLLPDLKKYLPYDYDVYTEIFAGGASLFFDLAPDEAILIDYNEELINFYLVVRDNLDALIDKLQEYTNTEEFYYKIRSLDREDSYKELDNISKAARFLFLNKTCWNGLYRVNSKNQFNVPFGKRTNVKIIDEERLITCSETLKNTEILNAHFSKILDYIEGNIKKKKYKNKKFFVYSDPPYDVIENKNSFTSYTKNTFGKKEQEFVKNLLVRLDSLDVKWMLSNSNTPFIQGLYKDYNINIIKANRFINSDSKNRGKVEEVLVTNYETKPQSFIKDLFRDM